MKGGRLLVERGIIGGFCSGTKRVIGGRIQVTGHGLVVVGYTVASALHALLIFVKFSSLFSSHPFHRPRLFVIRFLKRLALNYSM